MKGNHVIFTLHFLVQRYKNFYTSEDACKWNYWCLLYSLLSSFVILHFNVYLQMLEVVVLCLHDMLLIINFIDYFFENFRTIWTSCSCLCTSLMRERFDFLWDLVIFFYFVFPMVSLYLIEHLSSCTSYEQEFKHLPHDGCSLLAWRNFKRSSKTLTKKSK